MINPNTMKQALEDRGIDTSQLTEGRSALDWLVDDQGDHISPHPFRHTSPEMVLAFSRVGYTGKNRDEAFRTNSGLALAPCHRRIFWIG